MKRCITAHEVKSFGAIPEGSLWDDESPFVTDLALFEDVPDEDSPKPAKAPVRKFGAKKAAAPAPVEVVESPEEGESDGS